MSELRRSNRLAGHQPQCDVATHPASALPSIELEGTTVTEVPELGKAVVNGGNKYRIKAIAPHRLTDSLSDHPTLPDAAMPTAASEVLESRRCDLPSHNAPKSKRAGKARCPRPAPKRVSPKRYFYSEPEDGGKDLRKRKIPHLGEIDADGSRKRARRESKSPSSDITKVNTDTLTVVSDTAVAPRNGTIIRIPAAARHWRRSDRSAVRSKSPSLGSPAVKVEPSDFEVKVGWEMSPRASATELNHMSSIRPCPPVKDEPPMSPSAVTQNNSWNGSGRSNAPASTRWAMQHAPSPQNQTATDAPTPPVTHRPGHVWASYVRRVPPPAPRWLPQEEGEVRRLLALLHNVFGQLMYEVLSEQFDLPVETILNGLYSAYQHLNRAL